MARRVHIGQHQDGSYGLFVSKPTFDAKTTTSENMIFDSRLGNYGSVICSGTATSGTTIYFPQLPYIPLAYVAIMEGNNFIGMKQWGRSKTTLEMGNDPSGNPYYSGVQSIRNPMYRVTQSSIEIIRPSAYYSPDLPSQAAALDFSVSYVVWRCLGGS